MQEQCDDASLHLSETVQPHGVLLILDAHGNIARASHNSAQILGIPAPRMVGMSARRALGLSDTAAWAEAVSAAKKNLRPILLLPPRQGPALTATLQRSGGCWMVEIEQDPATALRRNAIWQGVERAQLKLLGAPNLSQYLRRLAREIRFLTAFDRVKVYRFDADGHGQVLAEARHPEMDSYLGHHFPASDIPPRSRALLSLTLCRSIVDIAARPSPLVGAGAGESAEGASGWPPPGAPRRPVDMARAVLRPAAQVHCEYLANMQVAASMTLSLMVGGRLWGLVACHHRTPRHVPPSLRHACELLVRHISAGISLHLRERNARQARLARRRVVRVAARIGQAADLGRALTQGQPGVLSLVADRRRASAAVLARGRWSLVGSVPPLSVLEGLERWLAVGPGRAQFFATDQLGRCYPPARAFANLAAGLIALRVAGPEPTVVMWFLPERIYSRVWAGASDKAVVVDPHGGLHPRASFARFTEVVRGRCLALGHGELSAARMLRRHIVEDNLHRQIFTEKRVRSDAQRQRWRTTLLAEATQAASHGLDLSSSGRAMARAVTSFCDLCELYVETPEGWQRLASCHRTHQGQAIADTLQALPTLSADGLSALLAQRGQRDRLLLPIVDAHQLRQLAPEPALRHVLGQRLGLSSLAIAPMVARDQRVGLLVVWRAGPAEPFTLPDDELVAELASRAASAVDNARSFHQATDALAVRDQVLNMVSHDLRSPLSLITLTLEHIERRQQRLGLDAFVAGLGRSLGRIGQACRQMSRLVDDILCLSKLEAGTLLQEVSLCSVRQLVCAAIDQLEPLVQAQNMQLICEVEGGVADPPPPAAMPCGGGAAHAGRLSALAEIYVACDAGRIQQVFGNLIGNAIKFSRPPAPLRLRVSCRDRQVVFAVIDRGWGMAPNELSRVFERHYQAGRHSQRGAGLGLAIVKGIVEAHAGEVAAESEPEVGSTFSFSLPRSPAPSASASALGPAPALP